MIVATPKQINYIEILANDLGFDRKKRNLSIQSILLKEIKALDELSKFEASVVIGKFKEWKESRMTVDEYSGEEDISF